MFLFHKYYRKLQVLAKIAKFWVYGFFGMANWNFNGGNFSEGRNDLKTTYFQNGRPLRSKMSYPALKKW